MTSVQTPPLSRSGSSPSNVGSSHRGGPSAAPPTSLSLRSSYNHLLGRDVIRESEAFSSATLPKSRQRYGMTAVRSAAGLSDNPPTLAKNQAPGRGRGLPTKSSSSSALYSSSVCNPFNTTNPKLAKNGANMQRRAESQQMELCKAGGRNDVDNNNPNFGWPEASTDNSQLPPFRRRTKSFLEYHGKGLDLDLSWGRKEEENKQPSPVKEQASPVKERESQKEEKPADKHPSPLDKEEEKSLEELNQEEKVEDKSEEPEEEKEIQAVLEPENGDPTPTLTQPLLPVVVEAPLSTTSSSDSDSPEWLMDNQDHSRRLLHGSSQEPPSHGREDLSLRVPLMPHGMQSPAKPPRTSQPRVIKVELHPNNENQFLQQYPPWSPKPTRSAERSGTPTRQPRAAPVSTDPDPEDGLPKVGFRMDLPPDTPSEDEDSSWTTLSQETPSPQTPRETAEVWTEGELPPGWREVSASSEVYFWHVPTGTTQYHRPVAALDPQEASPLPTDGPDPEPRPQPECSEAQGPPAERPSSLISDSSVEPVPSPSGSSPSLSGHSPLPPGASPSPSCPSSPVADVLSCVPEASSSYTASELKDYPVYPDPSLKAFEGATLRYASLSLNPAAQLETVDLNTACSGTEDMVRLITLRSLGWVEMAERDLCEGRSSIAVHHCIRQLSYCRRDIRDSAGGKGMLLELQDRMLMLVDPEDRSLLHSQPISSIRVWGVGRDHDRDFAYVARDKNTRVLKCHVFRCDTPAAAIATSLHQVCSKTELVQKFHVLYLGMTSVSRPIGMDVINSAIENLLSSSGKEDWTPVMLSVADATVAVIKEKLRYQKCLVARPPSQRAASSSSSSPRSPSPSTSPDSVTRRVTTSVKRGVLSLIDTLKTKKQPSGLPQ
ncbi:hypothetical protein NHX12_010841 [Muraenolepis orangiensis]|uniref:Uncharacterized protein n=1 Tax=Muraenolepis orangiensis TaxID=630683 RepID=A0A9Q0DEZ7_9TELE|nr:hypothetical protein NHX12_010841 [Muraenolepis orangiensis]